MRMGPIQHQHPTDSRGRPRIQSTPFALILPALSYPTSMIATGQTSAPLMAHASKSSGTSPTAGSPST